MKKLLYALLLSCLLVGCAANAESTKAPEEIKDEEVLTVHGSGDTTVDFSDTDYLFEDSQYVAIATIDEISGADSYSPVYDANVMPYSFGKMTIQTVYKGDLSNGVQADFYRMGGMIPYEKYLDFLEEPQREKLISTLGDKEPPKYVDLILDDDISLEEGKTYLVYLKDAVDYTTDSDAYTIRGFQGGLREINTENGTALTDSQKVMVYNNYTNQWEKLSDVLPADLTK